MHLQGFNNYRGYGEMATVSVTTMAISAMTAGILVGGYCIPTHKIPCPASFPLWHPLTLEPPVHTFLASPAGHHGHRHIDQMGVVTTTTDIPGNATVTQLGTWDIVPSLSGILKIIGFRKVSLSSLSSLPLLPSLPPSSPEMVFPPDGTGCMGMHLLGMKRSVSPLVAPV